MVQVKESRLGSFEKDPLARMKGLVQMSDSVTNVGSDSRSHISNEFFGKLVWINSIMSINIAKNDISFSQSTV